MCRSRSKPTAGDRVQVVLVHGLARTPFSMVRLARCLRRAGHETATVGYVAAFESFDHIRVRLRDRLVASGARGPYAAVGHSLGGVLLRAALADVPASQLPTLLVTLGTPTRPPRLARRLRNTWLYKRLAGDCGQLLANADFLETLPVPRVPYTAIAGTRGWRTDLGPFAGAPNDGVVAVDETTTAHAIEHLRVRAFHTFLMNNAAAQKHICLRLDALANQRLLG